MNIEMHNGEGCIALGIFKGRIRRDPRFAGQANGETYSHSVLAKCEEGTEFLSTALTEGDSRNLGNAQGQAPTSTTTN
jgi:hypothetical protein